MLQALHEKFTGWLGVVIFGSLGVLMAVAFGAGSYAYTHRDNWVAKVDGHKISQNAFRKQMNQLRRQANQRQGDKFKPGHFEKPSVKKHVLDGMINRYLLHKSSNDLDLVVTKSAIRAHIAAIPAFQVNGKFDAETYQAVLANNRLTPLTFQKEVRSNLETRLLPSTIAATSTLGKSDVDDYLKLQLQTRDLHYVVLPRPALENTKVSDAAVTRYYKAHQSQFMKPERVAVKYIEVNAAKLNPDAKISNAKLKARYQQEKSQFVEPEQRLVSHILIKIPKNATPEQKQKALAKARKIDAMAHQKGADFAALAKKYSQDIGSASQGGSLGWLQKGVTGKAFQKAMFSMSKGQISKPILTPTGYHIIWLRGIRAGKTKPFSEVRGKLLSQIKKTDRERKYSKVAGKLTDMVYKNPTTLAPAAKKLGLTIQQTGLFSRKGGNKGLAANPKVVKAAFSDNVLKDGNTSNPIKLGTNHIVVIHVVKHKKAAPKPIASVSDTIRQRILDQRVEQKAQKHAKALFAKLNQGKALDQVAKTAKLPVRKLEGARRHQKGVNQALLDKAFSLPHPQGKQPHFAMVSLGHGSYALLALNAVHPGDPGKVPKLQRQMLLAQMRKAYAATATHEWLKMLKSKANIKISEARM